MDSSYLTYQPKDTNFKDALIYIASNERGTERELYHNIDEQKIKQFYLIGYLRRGLELDGTKLWCVTKKAIMLSRILEDKKPTLLDKIEGFILSRVLRINNF